MAFGLPPPAPQVIGAVAWRCRQYAPPQMWGDLEQIGALAAWQSYSVWKDLPEIHAKRYLGLRVQGAILDEARLSLGGRGNKGAVSIEYGHDTNEDQYTKAGDSGADPLGDAMTAQATRAIERLRPPLPFVARRFIEGATGIEIAAELGVTKSMVSRHLNALRVCLARYIQDMPASSNA